MKGNKRGRGRPRLDVPNGRCSRRQVVNSMYVKLIKRHFVRKDF